MAFVRAGMVPLVLAGPILAVLPAIPPALADGGKGGDARAAHATGVAGASGGAGGGDGASGQNGGDRFGFAVNGAAGGGGGGAGGGSGGSGGSAGGAPGGTAGQDGTSVVGGGIGGAGGGGGGSGGVNGLSTAGGVTLNSAIGGGSGGAAGNGGDTSGVLSEGGGGGGGGAGGYAVIITGATTNTNKATIASGSGGAGGRGGDASGGGVGSQADGGNGGSGGDGSAGIKLTAGGASLTNNGTVQGGNGGVGGRGGNASGQTPGIPGVSGSGGNGGVGAAGVVFMGISGTLTNLGTIQGGNGGAVGVGGVGTGGAINGTAGNAGSGGVGVIGSNLSIINDGAIIGGLSGNGVTRADAIVFTGGVNFLSGTGTVGSFTMTRGGTFAPGSGTPGSSATVSGKLAFQSGASYLVQVNPAAASFVTVTGAATLGGATVNAVFAGGSYISKRYTILTAADGVSGTFGSLVNANLPANFSDTLSYGAADVFLNLTASLGAGGGLNTNQQIIANSINNFFNSGGSLPAGFVTLFGLTGANLGNALTQLTGEGATGSQQTTFDAMGQFMGLLTDPFMGRGNGINGAAAPTGFAQESADAYAASRSRTDAYAMFTKAPPRPFEQRWSVWAVGYGGSQTTSGDLAVLGSNDTRSSIYGTAVGADYRFSPNTLAGFALAGGGTNFSVNNLGSGRSDLFQAGAYIRHTNGAAYITGALAYGWQDITTNRSVTVAGIDQLRAKFNANAYSGRLEGGYRFVAPWVGGIGITPYAAGQFSTFDLPSYMEQAIVGSNQFALAYNSKSVTDTRSELGLRSDKSFAMAGGIFTLRGRLAWAHDFNPDRSVAATFQTLPGASFVVNGARQASDSALTTASAEWKWLNGWSAAATFEGEFSNVTRSYAGKGVVRYAW